MKSKLMTIMMVFLMVVGITACGTYYHVKDPSSGNTYYTEEIDDMKDSGAVKFKDAKTGSVVTIQSSEVTEISEEEFKENTNID